MYTSQTTKNAQHVLKHKTYFKFDEAEYM